MLEKLRSHEDIVKLTSQQKDWELFDKYNKMLREGNPLAVSGQKSMQKLGTIPINTYYLLKKLDPTLFDDKKRLREFFTKFKVFAATDKGSAGSRLITHT